jgi:hypothetical protein
MTFTKSKRALESELGSYSRVQKDISDRLRMTAPSTEAAVNYGEDNVSFEVMKTNSKNSFFYFSLIFFLIE